MGRRKIVTDDMNPEIKKLYTNNDSLSEIGIKLNIHPQIVKRRLQSMGIKIRDKSQAMKIYHEKRRSNERK
jgi:hypothetical protein